MRFEAFDERREIEMLTRLYTHLAVRCRRKVRLDNNCQRHVGGGQRSNPFRQPVGKPPTT